MYVQVFKDLKAMQKKRKINLKIESKPDFVDLSRMDQLVRSVDCPS